MWNLNSSVHLDDPVSWDHFTLLVVIFVVTAILKWHDKYNDKKKLNWTRARSRRVFSERVDCSASGIAQCHWPAELESPRRVNSFILTPWHKPHPKNNPQQLQIFVETFIPMRIGRAVNMFRPVFASAGIQHMHKPQTQGLDVLLCSSHSELWTPLLKERWALGVSLLWHAGGVSCRFISLLGEQKASKVRIPLCNNDVWVLRAGSWNVWLIGWVGC